jgi:GntR family transcriptional regulator
MTLDKESDAVLAFRLDPVCGVPTYLQLVGQVQDAVRLGRLVPGDRLPTVKEVVAMLAINPNTVLKAYRELEHRGIAAGRPGVGTFIEAVPAQLPQKDLLALRADLDRWLTEALAAGLDPDDVRALFNGALHDATHGAPKVAP